MTTLGVYSAFALRIASEVPLLELPWGSGEPDVALHLGLVAEAVKRGDALDVVVNRDHTHGWIPEVGAFKVRGGRHITLEPVSDVDPRALRLAIVGPLLGVVLWQRGKCVLHASTVAIGGRAVAFCGPSGAGKSTLAAALLRSGHALLADDITVIDRDAPIPLVEPGFPRIKLWPDSASALSLDTEALPLLHPDRSKRSLLTTANFAAQPLPLARCYLLREGPDPSICELSASDAVLSLVKCTYQSQWLHDTATAALNLATCGKLVRSGAVRGLQRPRSFDALAALTRLIEQDVRTRAIAV
jgi:hypothetical protein